MPPQLQKGSSETSWWSDCCTHHFVYFSLQKRTTEVKSFFFFLSIQSKSNFVKIKWFWISRGQLGLVLLSLFTEKSTSRVLASGLLFLIKWRCWQVTAGLCGDALRYQNHKRQRPEPVSLSPCMPVYVPISHIYSCNSTIIIFLLFEIITFILEIMTFLEITMVTMGNCIVKFCLGDGVFYVLQHITTKEVR